ncbi:MULTISPECIES: hypothetical protein [Sphingomonas]|jgi:hypothetical protein|uniref:Uncharacterized protein n=1 Tax=Sphingomonas adhaesiva TaxID=28212 RepID=A0A2A4IB03_9SPHN|nr:MULTISPECIES: hypothetical protein [Sphingomonas]PCG16137.1 hypothetical protein COA07_04200 [Sphingomonas adhaesiva]PZU79663.1 MAG: hypothetical protein DI530_08105 [Sphingomonas sp.]
MARGYPDGLQADHTVRRRRAAYATPVAMLLLGGVLMLALTGMLGGARSPAMRADAPDAVLTVKTPRTLRSGLFFETIVTVAARRPIADAVVAVPPALWRDMTINTQLPAAETEAFRDGRWHLHYGPLAAGERLEVKIDGQINPPLTIGTRGDVTLLDGERELARVPVTMRVLP